MSITGARLVIHLAALDAAGLVAELETVARQMKAHELVVEITHKGCFRIVKEGNTAQGIFANRHAMIGLLVCLAAVDPAAGPNAFWKEVLS
ncbi:MAG TPA: hypothetical protein VL357_03180 [Rariglobus sp.]|jgi:hypothetical protein|nr:hypothetical protein [Rariglobus sp.]